MIPSKTERRAAIGLIKIVLVFVMSIVLDVQPCRSQSYHERIDIANSLHKKTRSWEDSLRRLKPRTRPVYTGFNVSFGVPQYQLNSNIAVLNNLPVNYFGGLAGGVLANPIGKLKGGIGIYCSGDNVPYTFDLLTANLSVNVYLLRIKKVKYHTWEPYIFSGLSQMKNKFYGSYLPDPSTRTKRTSSADPYIGSVVSTHLMAGAGVEYQLENDNRDFIHLYAEISFGRDIGTNATTDALSDTTVPGSLWITVGTSFGKFR